MDELCGKHHHVKLQAVVCILVAGHMASHLDAYGAKFEEEEACDCRKANR